MMTYWPTLSGFKKEPSEICDELLMATFASDYSQSNAFLGHVSSFQHVVHQSGQNFIMMGTVLESMFQTLASRFFDSAEVVVRARPMEQDTTKIVITLSARLLTNEGQQYDLSSQVQAADGLALKILVGDRELWTRH